MKTWLLDKCIKRDSKLYYTNTILCWLSTYLFQQDDDDGLWDIFACIAHKNSLLSVNLLMPCFNGKKVICLSVISLLLLYSYIQMATAWDERISLYWTWLNAVLMKAHADNSFFIMSLARLGISFSVAGKVKFWFSLLLLWTSAVSLSGIRLCIWNIIFILHFCTIKLHGETRVWAVAHYLLLKIDVCETYQICTAVWNRLLPLDSWRAGHTMADSRIVIKCGHGIQMWTPKSFRDP